MSVFKWSLKHKSLVSDVQGLVESLGFSEEGRSGMYIKKISAGTYWREMKVRLRPEEVVCFLYKAEETTTETYFDYLIKAGFLMGQLASKMELLAVKEEGEEVPAPEDDEEGDDDENLEGYDA